MALALKVYPVEGDITDYNPRQGDNAGQMVCCHRRYGLGDVMMRTASAVLEHIAQELKVDYDDTAEEWSDGDLYALIEQRAVILPLFLFDHSGLSMSTARPSCPWDSGQVG